MSPERTRYAVEELVTNGTVWSYLLGQGYESFRGLSKDKQEQHIAMALSRTPVIKRFFGVTNPYSKHATKIEKVEEANVLQRFIENRGMDTLVDAYLYDKSATREEVIKYATSFKDKDTYDRLIDRFKYEEAIKTLPEKTFWKRLKGLSVESRATLFADRLKSSNDIEKAQLWKEYGIVAQAKGIISKDFRSEVMRLMAEE